ncbi:MAG: hypothetical protein IPP63_18830 [Chloracidobacterium sp.]|nr:hypothetical protein [Chloracidobacterium sp.]
MGSGPSPDLHRGRLEHKGEFPGIAFFDIVLDDGKRDLVGTIVVPVS